VKAKQNQKQEQMQEGAPEQDLASEQRWHQRLQTRMATRSVFVFFFFYMAMSGISSIMMWSNGTEQIAITSSVFTSRLTNTNSSRRSLPQPSFPQMANSPQTNNVPKPSFPQIANSPQTPCSQLWGDDGIESVRRSRCAVTGRHTGRHTVINHYSMVRYGAPSQILPTGQIGMVVISRNLHTGTAQLSKDCRPSKWDARFQQAVAWSAEWQQCPHQNNSQKRVLFILDGIPDLHWCHPWHRMAAIYPIWVSRRVLRLSEDEVHLLRSQGPLHKCLASNGLQAVSSHEFQRAKPPFCNFTALVAPMTDGFLWDLAWSRFQPCGPSSVLMGFTREIKHSFGLKHVSEAGSVQICMMSRAAEKKRTLRNEKQLSGLASSCKLSGHPTQVKMLNFTHELSFMEQIGHLSNCDVLVGVHGAGMTHLLWLQPESVVIEMLPHNLDGTPPAYAYYRNIAKLTGQTYFGIVAKSVDNSANYQVDLAEARRALEAALFRVSSKGSRRFIGVPQCASS